MADWYVSSTAWAAVPVFAAGTPYSIGQFVRSAAPSQPYAFFVHRCTTAGTSGGSEPGWGVTDGATCLSGTVTFTNVSGRAVYGWSAPAGNLYSMSTSGWNRPSAGDRLFVSSDHVESIAASYAFGGASFGVIQFISVNKAGSVPPVAADMQSGATINAVTNNDWGFESNTMLYWQGFTFTTAGTSSGSFRFNSGAFKTFYFKNCAFVLGNTTTGARFYSNNPSKVYFDNTTVQFGHTSQFIQAISYSFELTWANTPNAIQGGIIPANLFSSSNAGTLVTCRGVDLSALVGNLVLPAGGGCRVLLDGCRVNPTMTRLAATAGNPYDEVELINCYDGSSFISERHLEFGGLTTDRNVVLSGGAQDSIGVFSFKMATNSNADQHVLPLLSFWLDVENTVIGTGRVATVEVISSTTLTNLDLRLTVEFMGTVGSSITSWVDSAPALSISAPLPISSGTWLNPPATPVKQYLQVTFTPQVAGRLRGRVRLGKPGTIVWINPQVTLT